MFIVSGTLRPPNSWRHRLVWLKPDIDEKDVLGVVGNTGKRSDNLGSLQQWIALGRPVVGRTRTAADPSHLVPVGLALPPKYEKKRLAFCINPEKLAKVTEPLALMLAAEQAPDAARAALAAIYAESRQLSLSAHLYGSVAWECLSGEAYVTDTSDIDLLARPLTLSAAHAWLDLMSKTEGRHVLRLDGEIEFPSGDAVAWRELASTASRVLVKTDLGARMESKSWVWKQF